MEIERKFLISRLPKDFTKYHSRKLRQGYLAISESGVEVRVRGSTRSFSLTVKGGGDIERIEVEVEITRDQFEMLWPLTEGRRIIKRRYYIPYGRFTLECDLYLENLSGLKTAEVEFADLKKSRSFSPPEWFGKEISEDPRYKNKNLALHGVPANE